MSLIRHKSGRLALTGFAVLVFMASGCHEPGRLWSRSYSFPDCVWTEGEVVVFTPDSDVLKTEFPSKAVITLRYGADAPSGIVPVVIEAESPLYGRISADTMRLQLLDADQKTPDRGRFGVFEVNDTVDLKFRLHPGSTVSFFPLERDMKLEGMYSLTLDLLY